MQPYTDVHGRAWELTPTPAHNAYAGGHVIGYLCWVKSAAPNSHPGDYARTGHSRAALLIVSPNPADAITAGQAFADAHP